MSAFQFRTIPHLISEPGASSQLGTHISQQFPTVRRVLLVTYPGFLSTGLVDTPLRSLQQAGIEVHVFSGVQADPPEAVVLAAVHALAYPIGGMFHVPHGLSNALVLPHVLRFNLGHAPPCTRNWRPSSRHKRPAARKRVPRH